MKQIATHRFLIKGDSFENCRDHINRYLGLSTLVRYDHLEIAGDEAIDGSSPFFFAHLDHLLEINNDRVEKLIEDIKSTGITSIDQLPNLKEGYQSKLLHLLAHFIDGFIGIDSSFYNLIDDSHRVSPERLEKIHATPLIYWIISVKCFSTAPDKSLQFRK